MVGLGRYKSIRSYQLREPAHSVVSMLGLRLPQSSMRGAAMDQLTSINLTSHRADDDHCAVSNQEPSSYAERSRFWQNC
jgi:hypothetical protein